MIIYPSKLKTNLFIPVLAFLLCSCGGKKQVLASSQNTSLFLPPQIEAYVDMCVDKVDGKPTKFNLADSVVIDEGVHKILIRLEYQPAAGSAVLVGSLGNLLLRAGTNKTFTDELNISVAENEEYRFVVTSSDDSFIIKLKNESTNKFELEQSYRLADGKFTRIF